MLFESSSLIIKHIGWMLDVNIIFIAIEKYNCSSICWLMLVYKNRIIFMLHTSQCSLFILFLLLLCLFEPFLWERIVLLSLSFLKRMHIIIIITIIIIIIIISWPSVHHCIMLCTGSNNLYHSHQFVNNQPLSANMSCIMIASVPLEVIFFKQWVCFEGCGGGHWKIS